MATQHLGNLAFDALDAMTTDRPYRQAVPVQRAIDELNRYAGKQFDPYLVKIFTDFIQEKERANFCDYFQVRGQNKSANQAAVDLLAAAESLFKAKT